MMNLYWGDLHNHHDVGYGQGSLERATAIAEASLDVHALTPHGWWPDVPDDQSAVKQYHGEGFERVVARWDDVVGLSRQLDKPGRFVSLLGFEWHSLQWGDYCALLPPGVEVISRPNSIEELQDFAKTHGALLVPHHCAYAVGARGTSWPDVDSSLSPVAEVFSEHGNSLETPSLHGMYGHSMGSSELRQSVAYQLTSGRVVGFVGGTDNHYGHPGAYGEGLTAIYAPSLTRESILEALRARHCYAVTGDRVRLQLSSGSAMMGDVLPSSEKRAFHLAVDGLAPLESVTIVKNGFPAAVFSPSPPISGEPVASGKHFVQRLEWGWGGLHAKDATEWRLRFTVTQGRVTEAIPCFVSGPDTTEKTNTVNIGKGGGEVTVHSVTTRSNTLPVQSVVLRIEGGPTTHCRLLVSGTFEGTVYETERRYTVKDGLLDDTHLSLSASFTSPRLKIHRLLTASELSFVQDWRDEAPTTRDFYYVKVLQQNGHCAWSSPIWFAPNKENNR